MRICFAIFLIITSFIGSAQTIGGSAAYNFLKLPSNSLLTATGGVNTSYSTNEVGLSSNNPALLNPQLHSQLNLSFNNFPGGIKAYSATAAYNDEKIKTTFGGHVYFIDYGTIAQTDASGNVSGNFRPVDFVIQVGAAKSYLEKWTYGLNLKFINSTYQQYNSSAIAFDVGILYADTNTNFSASVLAKNMGFQINSYTGQNEDLPFDLQIGVTKRLAKAPFAFSLTAQHVHQFDLNYNDTTFNNENGLGSGNNFFNKLLNHFVVASHIFLGNNLEAIIGYNHLRREELNMGLTGNGLNGYSTGVRIKFQKLQVLYSRANYQRNIAYNQIGLTLQLNQLFGLREL